MANSIRVDHPESQTNCCFFFASWQEVLGPQKAISFAGLLTLFGNPIWRTRGQPKSQDLRSRIKRGQVDHSLIFFGSRQQFELRQMKGMAPRQTQPAEARCQTCNWIQWPPSADQDQVNFNFDICKVDHQIDCIDRLLFLGQFWAIPFLC